MRLLNTRTFELRTFFGQVPPYAILSHTWESEETTFDEDIKHVRNNSGATILQLQQPGSHSKVASDRKVSGSARVAREQGYDYIWIDTLCIDKSSSAELSEAINSMFAWYRDSEVCYAYLADVTSANGGDAHRAEFMASRWVTRGWTLQELVAPKKVLFYTANWRIIGHRTELSQEIHDITGIAEPVLQGATLDKIAVGTKMSWLSRRVTTRPEDMAYCMLGIFDVNLPLLYGEGLEKGFIRLQEAILSTSEDESIFAWHANIDDIDSRPWWGLLATKPACFANSGEYALSRYATKREGHPTVITNRGMSVELELRKYPGDGSGTVYLAMLQITKPRAASGRGTHHTGFAILLQRVSDLDQHYARIEPTILFEIEYNNREHNLVFTMVPSGRSEQPPLTGTLGMDSTDQDPGPCYFFVRPDPRPARLVAGFQFRPEISPTISGQPQPVVQVAHHDWLWTIEESSPFGIVIDFASHDSLPGILDTSELEAPNLKERRALAMVEVVITSWCGWKSTEVESEMGSKKVVLVIGLELPPKNPFGTPNGYTRPWY
ncbi:heterokaryon incompatibility protein-domain-containing protein, partial [Diplogelasinospora grovesii]